MFLSFTSKGSFLFFLQDLFIYFCERTEREREQAHVHAHEEGGGAEGEGDSPLSRENPGTLGS